MQRIPELDIVDQDAARDTNNAEDTPASARLIH
jgi:hypothetical protein